MVGKAHVPGIRELWDKETSALCASALEEPSAPIGSRAMALAFASMLPFASYRYRAVRIGMGISFGVLATGGAWFTLALRDRLRFFEKSQSTNNRTAE